MKAHTQTHTDTDTHTDPQRQRERERHTHTHTHIHTQVYFSVNSGPSEFKLCVSISAVMHTRPPPKLATVVCLQPAQMACSLEFVSGRKVSLLGGVVRPMLSPPLFRLWIGKSLKKWKFQAEFTHSDYGVYSWEITGMFLDSAKSFSLGSLKHSYNEVFWTCHSDSLHWILPVQIGFGDLISKPPVYREVRQKIIFKA